jgi:chromosome segregation ATPase
MIELIMKMVACLLVALLLGFIIGWLLNKIFKSQKYISEIDMLNGTLESKNREIETLEAQFVEKETTLLKYNDENRELKASLADKSNLLDTHTVNLTTMQNRNEELLKQVTRLKEDEKRRAREIEELESVLVKAEETIEEKSLLYHNREDELSALRLLSAQEGGGDAISLGGSSSDDITVEQLKGKIEELRLINEEKDHSIELYQNTIGELENELKLYTVNGEDDEFIISKDQFTHIEEQLVEYQKEIKSLKEENSLLVQKSSSEKLKSKDTSSDLDDIAIVKLFRETYKKITNS